MSRCCAACVVVLAAALAACGAVGPVSSAPASRVSAGAPSNRSIATPPRVATPLATLSTCRPTRDVHALRFVHRFSVSPDDIAVDAQGGLWVTARQADQLINLSTAGAVLSTQTVSGGPEGVASDGTAEFVAQQDRNAVAEVDPHRAVVSFANHTANLGTDGIALDAVNHRLLVPDSPTGQLFAVSLTGAPAPQLVAAGLGRPVAAASDAAGDVFVASESSPGLTELLPSGERRTIGRFTNLDEVVTYGGLVYVTELDRHDVVAIDPSTGTAVPIASNLPAPQGLAVTAAGTLEIVDATTQVLYSIPACGVSS